MPRSPIAHIVASRNYVGIPMTANETVIQDIRSASSRIVRELGFMAVPLPTLTRIPPRFTP